MTTRWTSRLPTLRSIADRALDLAVVPGFGSPGYRLRSGAWSEPAGPSAVAGADVIVTGASAGIGEAACAGLAARGARVHMVARDGDRLEAAAARVRGRLGASGAGLETWQCDLSDLDAVRAFAAAFRARRPDLRGVLHNAGVLTDERRRTREGHELTHRDARARAAAAHRVAGARAARGGARPGSSSSRPAACTRPPAADDLELEREEFDGSAVLLARQAPPGDRRRGARRAVARRRDRGLSRCTRDGCAPAA